MLVFGRRSRGKVLSGTFSCINIKDQTQSRIMTSQSPRIYTYKITFEEVPYYYYGIHKEKRFNDEYWGSPKTNKWCWELYTPKKQILELFDYTDEGWLKSQAIEKRLIRPFLNDEWCLNERCGSNFSLKVLSENGKKVGEIWGQHHRENGTGVFGRSREKMTEDGKKGTQIQKEMGTGVWGLTPEQRTDMGKKGGAKGGVIMGKRHYEEGTGLFSLTSEQKIENCSKGGKAINSQKWMCLETGFISTCGPLTIYQKARGIDTSKRERLH